MASVGSTEFVEFDLMDEDYKIDEEISTPKKNVQEDHVDEGPIDKDIFTPVKPNGNNELGVGTIFKSVEEAEICYNKYAGMNGFSIRRRSAYKGPSGEHNIIVFACSCEGTYMQKINTEDNGTLKRMGSSMRSGCKARLRIRCISESGSWGVTVFHDEHNHQLDTPSKRILLKSNKKVFREAKAVVECFQKENLCVSKSVSLFGDRDKVPFESRDLYNHFRDKRKINYVEGDAEGVKRYFQRAAAENPHFYYAIQCDEWGRAANFFWIDARSRIAYEQFGEAVTFDTTYNTNKYKMPFAPFTGVNHHHQSILFGCALLENETEETFTWLFETWLQAMGGKAPLAIITDQDAAMQKAIANVFPNARHRFCLWHIKKKFVEKLNDIYKKRSVFKRDVKRITRFCHSIEEFEDQWAAMLVTYNLQNNSWLQQLYVLRKQWIPVYCRDTFFAGMNTTQRSESINSFFGKFVTNKTDLRQFVSKYDAAMLQIYVSERREDFDSIYKKRSITVSDFLVDHAAKIYTKNLFVKFMGEYGRHNRLKLDEREIVGDVHTFSIYSRVGDTYAWTVTFNSSTHEGWCGCKLFEFYGIPCTHLIKVFDRFFLEEIPPYFIKKRWMKDANRAQVKGSDGIVMRNKHIGTEAARVSDICIRATQLAYIMCRSDEGYEKLCELFDTGFSLAYEMDAVLLKKEFEMAETDDGPTFVFPPTDTYASYVGGSSNVDALLLDPHISQTKGRKNAPKEGNENISGSMSKLLETGTGRMIGGLEKSTSQKPRTCQLCFGKYKTVKSHDSRTCPGRKQLRFWPQAVKDAS